MDVSQIVAVAVFVVVMITIMTEKLHRSLAAITGAMIVLALHVMPFDAAMEHIDFNTLGVLLGMMLFVSVVKLSGVFEFLAIKCARLAKGDPWKIMLLFVLLTAVLSAFLDNVTTVLLIGPMTLTVCKLLDVNPIPFFMTEILASNIGGTATLIGDPPNMIIASVAGFSFNDFIVILAPVAAVILCATTAYVAFYYKSELKSDPDAAERLSEVDESKLIVNRPLMIKSVVIIVLVLIGFTTHRIFHLDASVVALTAAGALLAISLLDEGTILHNDVEWPTIIYFLSLFIMAGGLKANGVLEEASKLLTLLFAGNPLLMLMATLWISGLVCAFINNIAFTAIFVHIIGSMGQAAGVAPEPLYWALALGACLGGNGTYFGAAANAVVADFAAREGIEIPFAAFSRIGLRIVFISLLISSAALLWIGRGLWM